jgi:aspartyl-tRNA(Asn)/glutamyl-tRNA(Gln) amidotransferase subunit A
LNCDGVMPLSPTLDHVGVHAASVADVALVMGVFGVRGASRERLRIGVGRWGKAVSTEPIVAQEFEGATATLRAIWDIEDVDLSATDFGALRRRGLLVSEAEGYREHQEMLRAAPSGFSRSFTSLLEYGAAQPSEKIAVARASLAAAARNFVKLFDLVDVIVLPTAPQGPFSFDDEAPANQADFTCMANFAGLPAIATPISRDGAPPGSIQFIGGPGADARTIAAAAAFEAARGLASRPSAYF